MLYGYRYLSIAIEPSSCLKNRATKSSRASRSDYSVPVAGLQVYARATNSCAHAGLNLAACDGFISCVRAGVHGMVPLSPSLPRSLSLVLLAASGLGIVAVTLWPLTVET